MERSKWYLSLSKKVFLSTALLTLAVKKTEMPEHMSIQIQPYMWGIFTKNKCLSLHSDGQTIQCTLKFNIKRQSIKTIS